MIDGISAWNRNQQFALVSALIYAAAGILGFVVTGFDGFAADSDERLVVLGLNPLHNVVHLTLAASWLAAAFSPVYARTLNAAIGVGLLAAFALGAVGGAQFLNIDGVTEPDNFLHLVYGAASLAVARSERAGAATETPAPVSVE